MADVFTSVGKNRAMNGIKDAISSIELLEDTGASIEEETITGSSFTVDSGGEISNNTIITFTIAEVDVDKTVASVELKNVSGVMIRLDLDANVSLTTAGEAEFAVGALTATL